MIIKILDPIQCQVSRPDAQIIRPILSFPSVFYRQGFHRKERVEYQKSTMLKSSDGLIYYFYTGFLERVVKHCKDNGIPCQITGEIPKLPYGSIPDLPNGSYREDQLRLIHSALEKQRGVLQAPTGSGKTFLAAGLISAFNRPTIFIVHTLTLVRQTAEEFKKFGLKNVTTYTGEEKDLRGDIVVGTIQSFSKIPQRLTKFDVVVTDEAHHVGRWEGTYSTVLRNLPCTARFGFTATLPTTAEAKMTLEAFIGPLIDSFSLEEGIEEGILAKPKIKLVKIPINYRIKELFRYQDVYDQGITNNRARNEVVVDSIIPYIKEGKTVLVLLTRIEHGENIRRIAEEKGLHPYFLRGATETEQREEVKQAFKDKDIKLVIATTIWKEGINIPSLDVICNAAGGKSEIATLQSIGRGLRTTKDKTEVILLDFFDPSDRFFVEHFGLRLCLYFENNWI